MHLPDGYLAAPVWATLDVFGAGVVGLSVAWLRGRLPEDAPPRMGVLGAFVFAAQVINVPVAFGTSGHLLGGVLVAGLLGPVAAGVVMAAVFVIQCLVFQDGGLTALGANFVNMGLVGAYGGWALLSVLRRVLPRDAAVFAAAWASVVATSALVAVELALSDVVALAPSLAAMTAVHAVIGLVEGAVTVAAVRFVERVRPELLAGTVLARR